jgi:lipid II:glycine glycyltransferase (peptidoglycan interpeptide bridge formation enzyme)
MKPNASEVNYTTLFSSEIFVNAWVRGMGQSRYPIKVSMGGGLSQHVIHGVATPCGFGYANGEFAPDGLYVSPSSSWAYSEEKLCEAVREFQRQPFLSVIWNVRFDHATIARRFQASGLSLHVSTTHVLSLDEKYEQIFAGYNTTRRNQLRKSRRRGIEIRRTLNDEDIVAYCEIHKKLAKQKSGFKIKYSVNLIREMVALHDHAILLVADYERRVTGGALFFLDGESMLYWHGAADREYGHLFASCALLDRGIQIACENGLKTFNFGGSATDSLREFKESFGARSRPVWTFAIAKRKPLVVRIRNKLGRLYAR